MRARSIVSFVAAACAAIGACGVGSAQVLFSENFNDGNAASRWSTSTAGGTNIADFAFDYSTVGIPSAPNGSGSTGLRFAVNTVAPGVNSAMMAFPNGQNFTPNYTLLFDLWMNVVGATATTEFAIFGGGHTSTVIQQPTSTGTNVGPSPNGIDFAVSGDEGAARDIRAYVNGLERTGTTPETAGGYARSTTATYTQDEAPAPYFFAYTGDAIENQWMQVSVTVTGTQSTWTMNTNTWARTLAATGTGNIMLGYMDIFTSVAALDIFGVYDNVRVIVPTAPTTQLTWAADGATAGGSGTWVNLGQSWLGVSGSVPWNWALPTIFSGAAGTVTINGAVTAGGGLDFRTDGYTITSGSLFLGATAAVGTNPRQDNQIFDPTASTQVNVASGVTATIASEVRGRMGLTKTGPGKLVLAGPNPVSGATTVQAGTIRLGNQYSLVNSPVSVGS
ncbi:MAG: autotransporter-associated beta strand repeat-containing protein, partial [Planctomycetota bacterium]